MTTAHDPRPGHAAPDAPEHQPVVDAFTDAAQADGERPVEREVDADDMFAPGGE